MCVYVSVFTRILPAQYLADTSMADSELSGDVTRPNPLVRELYDSLPHHVWEGPAVYEHAPQLVHPTVSWRKREEGKLAL